MLVYAKDVARSLVTRIVWSGASCFAALVCASCAPKLVPHVNDVSLQDYIRRAQVIAIGQVSAVEMTHRIAEAPDDKKWILRLLKADVRVENVLKGEEHGSGLTFYYYGPNGAFSLPSINLIGPGNRAIFFLERDHGVYRSVNDVYASCIHIQTGSHPGLSVDTHRTLERAIVEAALLPGPKNDLDRQRWPYYIEQGANIGERLVGKGATLELLQLLQQYPDYRVRTEACIAKAQTLLSRDACIDDVRSDLGFDRDFDAHVKRQLHLLLPRIDPRVPFNSKWPEPPLPGGPEVRINVRRVPAWSWR